MSDRLPKSAAALEFEKRQRLRTILRRVLLAFVVLVCLFTITPFGQDFWSKAFYVAGFADFRDPEEKPALRLHFIDVGDADSVLIESKGEAALLDAGYSDGGETAVYYLARQGIKELKFAIISHPDSDHVGGMTRVLNDIPVKGFMQSKIRSSVTPISQEYEFVADIIDEKEITLTELSAGDTFTVGEAFCEVLAPIREHEDTNNNSLVIKLTYGSFSALFCGDIENDAEKDIVKSGKDISARLLKVPHHGSDTSSTARFLEAIDPEYAVISTADIPKAEVMIRLEEYAEVYRTDVHGTVVFSIDGESIDIKTEK